MLKSIDPKPNSRHALNKLSQRYVHAVAAHTSSWVSGRTPACTHSRLNGGFNEDNDFVVSAFVDGRNGKAWSPQGTTPRPSCLKRTKAPT